MAKDYEDNIVNWDIDHAGARVPPAPAATGMNRYAISVNEEESSDDHDLYLQGSILDATLAISKPDSVLSTDFEYLRGIVKLEATYISKDVKHTDAASMEARDFIAYPTVDIESISIKYSVVSDDFVIFYLVVGVPLIMPYDLEFSLNITSGEVVKEEVFKLQEHDNITYTTQDMYFNNPGTDSVQITATFLTKGYPYHGLSSASLTLTQDDLKEDAKYILFNGELATYEYPYGSTYPIYPGLFDIQNGFMTKVVPDSIAGDFLDNSDKSLITRITADEGRIGYEYEYAANYTNGDKYLTFYNDIVVGSNNYYMETSLLQYAITFHTHSYEATSSVFSTPAKVSFITPFMEYNFNVEISYEYKLHGGTEFIQVDPFTSSVSKSSYFNAGVVWFSLPDIAVGGPNVSELNVTIKYNNFSVMVNATYPEVWPGDEPLEPTSFDYTFDIATRKVNIIAPPNSVYTNRYYYVSIGSYEFDRELYIMFMPDDGIITLKFLEEHLGYGFDVYLYTFNFSYMYVASADIYTLPPTLPPPPVLICSETYYDGENNWVTYTWEPYDYAAHYIKYVRLYFTHNVEDEYGDPEDYTRIYDAPPEGTTRNFVMPPSILDDPFAHAHISMVTEITEGFSSDICYVVIDNDN